MTTRPYTTAEPMEPPAMPCLLLTVYQAGFLSMNLPSGPLRDRMGALSARNPHTHDHYARYVVGVSVDDRATIRRVLKRCNTRTGEGRAILKQLDALRLANGGEVTP
jgi:hypothetical protein